MKYRSRTQIIVEILQVAANDANKTRIMYGAALSFKQMTEYLPQLVDKGLLEYNDKKKVYKVTAAGLDALSHYQKLNL
jgi:predicted transcriptional regulator